MKRISTTLLLFLLCVIVFSACNSDGNDFYCNCYDCSNTTQDNLPAVEYDEDFVTLTAYIMYDGTPMYRILKERPQERFVIVNSFHDSFDLLQINDITVRAYYESLINMLGQPLSKTSSSYTYRISNDETVFYLSIIFDTNYSQTDSGFIGHISFHITN